VQCSSGNERLPGADADAQQQRGSDGDGAEHEFVPTIKKSYPAGGAWSLIFGGISDQGFSSTC
jgi:hypothetical protein